MKHGPYSFLPFVNQYEQRYPEGKPILKNSGLADRDLRAREKKLINSYIHMPCRVQLIPERFGKIPSTLKNVIFMEYDKMPLLMAEYLPEPLNDNPDFISFMQTANLFD
jgi:hypothetical protein